MAAGSERHRGRRAALAAIVLVLLWLAMMTLAAGAGLDRVILAALYAGDRPLIAFAALWVTRLGDAATLLVVTAAGAGILFWRRRSRLALVLLSGTLLGRALIDLQKLEVARLRPDLEPPLVIVGSASFPSGHAGNSMIVYLGFALLLVYPARRRWWAAAAVALSLAIGVSRVVLGVHWPSDVVAGWAFGLLWVMVVWWLAGRSQSEQR